MASEMPLVFIDGEEHGTTAIDPGYDGPVQTAISNHMDSAHPGVNVIIEITSP